MLVELAADVVVELEVVVAVVVVVPAALVVEVDAAATSEEAADVATDVPFLFDAYTVTRNVDPTSAVVGT